MLSNVGNVEKWRIFIAVPIPTDIKLALADWCDERREEFRFQRWVHREDYHITMQFLGDTSPDRVDEIGAAIKRVISGIRPFSIEARGCGTFGRPDQPRVLWAGVDGEIRSLQQLQNNITQENRKLGFIPEDRPYRPHITLARKYREGSRFAADITELSPRFGSWTVDALVIYRTQMNRQPMYEQIASIQV